MNNLTTESVLAAAVLLSVIGVAFADEPKPKPAGSDVTAADASVSPSAETMKQARIAGYKPQTHGGTTVFCKEDAPLGSHLTKKQCIDESTLRTMLGDQQQQHDQMRKSTACSNGNCK